MLNGIPSIRVADDSADVLSENNAQGDKDNVPRRRLARLPRETQDAEQEAINGTE